MAQHQPPLHNRATGRPGTAGMLPTAPRRRLDSAWEAGGRLRTAALHTRVSVGMDQVRIAERACSFQRVTSTPAMRSHRHSDPSAGRIGSWIQGTRWGALGCCAAESREPRLAAHLLGAMESLRAEMGASTHAAMARALADATASAMAALGPRFQTEFTAGQRLSRDAAARLALREAAPPAVAAADQGSDGVLGRREADVARLVAGGLSNKEVGARLFISERTVESHVRRSPVGWRCWTVRVDTVRGTLSRPPRVDPNGTQPTSGRNSATLLRWASTTTRSFLASPTSP
jgi:hypothetical protein